MGLPYVRIWVPNFLGSTRVRELDGISRGIYLLALVIEADMNGAGLPAEPEALRRLCGVDPEAWERYWPPCRSFFELKDGRLFNDRMEREIADGHRNREQQIRAGKASGKARRDAAAERSRLRQELNGRSTLRSNDGSTGVAVSVERPLNPPSPSPSPSPSPDACSEACMTRATPDQPVLGRYTGDIYWRLTMHPWNFGHQNATAILERGVTEADLDAWEAYGAEKGMAAASKAIRQFKTPADVPAAPKKGHKPMSEETKKLLEAAHDLERRRSQGA